MKNNYKYMVIYMALMAVGLAINRFEKNILYSDPNFIVAMIPYLIVMSIWAIYSYNKGKKIAIIPWTEKGKYKIYLFVAVPVLSLAANVMAFNLTNGTFRLELIIGAMLVGIAEETMYRGIILKGLLVEKSIAKAIFISAFWFSILHFLNIIGGQSIGTVTAQLLITFIGGLFFGIIYIKIKKLLPLILLHGLWDYTVISSTSESLQWISKCAIIIVLIEIVIVIICLKNSNKYLKI